MNIDILVNEQVVMIEFGKMNLNYQKNIFQNKFEKLIILDKQLKLIENHYMLKK
jgi:hypothetical protein